jgi:ribosomal protein S18 acetylase RimI-like enzyme
MLNYRRFNKESDYAIMRFIVQQNCLEAGQISPQLHIGNLDFERYAFEESPDVLYKTTWIVENGETEIGFITVQENEFYITVLVKFDYFMDDIFNFIENNFYSHGNTISTDANSEDKLLNSILEQRGYTETGHFRFNGICDLSKVPLHMPLPDEYSIRLTQKKDIIRRVELFGLATGGVETTPENYERMMSSPSYCDAMDFVVEHHSEIVAYCTVWNDPISKIAILEPLACIAEHRRKGIMKNTLLYGMNILKDGGTKFVYVGTGGSNTASQALYKSVGFVEYGINSEWVKTL